MSEIIFAQQLFGSLWKEMDAYLHSNEHCFPKIIYWLNGAPGAGKGTHSRYLLECCGLGNQSILTISEDLLQSPEAKKIKDSGQLVGDQEVIGLLLRALLDPKFSSGVVVDGFPRTHIQAECLKLFYDHLNTLHKLYPDRFVVPNFHIIVLYVDELTSIDRQLHRGRQALINQQEDVRATDMDPAYAKKRYAVFSETTLPALEPLKSVFPYHFIRADGQIDEVRVSLKESLAL